MVIVEHKLADLMGIVDRVIVLNFGEVIARAPLGDRPRQKSHRSLHRQGGHHRCFLRSRI